MDSHIRINIDANWQALSSLQPVAYKVLISLCQRADNLGRCFPSAERIAEDCGCNPDTVFVALDKLEELHYISYLRRNERDLVTGRWLPNVYMVSPFFLVIGLECEEDAMRLWSALYPKNAMPLSEKLGINQQQEPAPLTNYQESAKETNNNNQRTFEKGGAGAPPDDSKKEAGYAKKAKKPKAKSQDKSEKPESDESQQGEAPQRSKKPRRSAASYATPEAVASPLPDMLLESLAVRVNRLGIPIPLARGLVCAYGGDSCETALLQVAAIERSGQKIDNAGGLFRHLLQNKLIDSALPEILDSRNVPKSGWRSWENDPETYNQE